MGIILVKLRKKKTTYEILENLDKDIRTIEDYRINTEQTRKRIVGRFTIASICVYLLLTAAFYFHYFPATYYDRLWYVIPLILAPVIIVLVKQVLTWYYEWKINRKQSKLIKLRDEKKKILEKVMETETYKVAKTILDKFAPETLNPRRNTADMIVTPVRSSVTTREGLRQRTVSTPSQQISSAITPSRPFALNSQNTIARQQQIQTIPRVMPAPNVPHGTPLPMPRPILPRERSVFDKMVDYLVGDGPSNRYALICKNCFSHNGMAFREELEYISFRCCYCFTFNPALKKKPAVPKLQFELKPSHTRIQSDTSESEKNSPSDTDSELETLLALPSSESRNISEEVEEKISQEKISLVEEVKTVVNNEKEKEKEEITDITQIEEVKEGDELDPLKD